MKRFFAVLPVAVLTVSLAGCTEDGGKDTCRDACNKMDDCGLLPVSLNQCIDDCEDRITFDEEATQDDIDCIMENKCGNIFNQCG